MLTPARLFQAAQTVGILGVAAGAFTIFFHLATQNAQADLAEKEGWRQIKGPPCRTIQHPSPAWLGGARPMTGVRFEGVSVYTKRGDAYCRVLDGHVACQVQYAGLVGMKYGGQIHWFDTPYDKVSTLRITPAGPVCVVGGWLDRLRAQGG